MIMLIRQQQTKKRTRHLFISLLFEFALVGVLLLLDFILRNDVYLSRVHYLKFISGWPKIFGVYGLVVMMTAFLLFSIRSIPLIGNVLANLLILLGLTINLVFYSVVEEFFDLSYVHVVLHSDSNAVLGAIKSYSSLKAVLFLIAALAITLLLAWLHQKICNSFKSSSIVRNILLFLLALTMNYILWNYLYFKLRYFPVEPISSSLRTLAFFEKEYREFYGIRREQLQESDKPLFSPAHHILLIIDESVRYDYLSNNNANLTTTPFLKDFETNPKFYNLGLTLAASTCSFHTKSLILTGTTKLPDVDRHALTNPSLFQYARYYGYETSILDAPGSNFPNIVIQNDDLQYVDEILRADEMPGESPFFDQRAITVIHEKLSKARGQFIVLIKKGAHFHYESSYPREQERFSRHRPRLAPYESYDSSREKMMNSYQNALSFTVDEFARQLFAKELSNLTLIWTSDHGQSLQEQGQTYTHCKSELEQAVVPLFLYSDHPWMQTLPRSLGSPGGIITSHHNLYPTIISLMSGNNEYENEGYYSLFSSKLHQHDLYYLYGGIWSQTHIMTTSLEELTRFFSHPLVR